MNHAYDWLKPEQRYELFTNLVIIYDQFKIILKAASPSSIKIVYEKFGHGTLIDFEHGKKSDFVSKQFSDSFCEDLGTLFKTQLSFMKNLTIQCANDVQIKPEEVKPVVSQIYASLFNSIKSKSQKLRIKTLSMDAYNVQQSLSIVLLLDPIVLGKLSLVFLWIDKIEIEGLLELVQWKGSSSPFEHFSIGVSYLSKENLVTVKKLISNTSLYKSFRCTCEDFEKLNFNGFFAPFEVDIIGGKDGGFIFASEDQQVGVKALEEFTMEKLSLQSSTSMNVFGNPLIMTRIMKELQCFDIQKLRRVSQNIRECIDQIKPEPHIESITFRLDFRRISLSLYLRNSEYKKIYYGYFSDSSLENCVFELVKKDSLISFEEFQSIISNDFDVNLKNQKQHLRTFRVVVSIIPTFQYQVNNPIFIDETNCYADGFLKIVKNALKSRASPLQIEKLELELGQENIIMDVLSFIDENYMKSFWLKRPNNINLTENFEVGRISKTDHWKKAEELDIKNWAVSTDVQDMNLIHFAKVNILVKTISSDDIFHLKENLIKSATLQRYKISYNTSTIDDSLLHLMGAPYLLVTDIRTIWYFRMNKPSDFLHIVHHINQRTLIFSRVQKESVPEDVL